MGAFSDINWEGGTVFGVLDQFSFFPYSGSDGDLFRKNGLAGWRVSVYGNWMIKIQKKRRPEIGGWATKRRWEVGLDEELPKEYIEDFESVLETLVETGELPKDD
ncbi:hypothetical protein RH831_10770 [Halodesulfurarchaeum sp. HSR-GB]|uniref:hypothetical protein n=1 Tax=Halodesulfurarchaeum sp. HSR-GB TaxID=3074077 RepID=UPI0028573A81|nr:hypothetical protein [Halodesulfurarchaeum sp. HSR-GB]MDR5657658.1 hypothetical protein [Halodesulfurarchaeum sp. HSR-GB]